jgi:hypothetical protein
MRSTIFFALFFFMNIRAPAQKQPAHIMNDDDYWFETTFLEGSNITEEHMGAIARRFLSSSAHKRRIAVLTVFSNPKVNAQQNDIACDHYRQWLYYFDRSRNNSRAVADVIAINGNAVLRVRSVTGVISRAVLKGADPTVFSLAGAPVEVLMLSGRAISDFEGCSIPRGIAPIAYLQTPAPLSLDLCRRAMAEFTKKIGAKRLHVSLRNDPWFICGGNFPIIYPFANLGEPPREQDYYRSRTFTCSVECDGTIACTMTTGIVSTDEP